MRTDKHKFKGNGFFLCVILGILQLGFRKMPGFVGFTISLIGNGVTSSLIRVTCSADAQAYLGLITHEF